MAVGGGVDVLVVVTVDVPPVVGVPVGTAQTPPLHTLVPQHEPALTPQDCPRFLQTAVVGVEVALLAQ